MGRVTGDAPVGNLDTQMLGWFAKWNAVDPSKPEGAQKPYAARVKPFGFLEHAPPASGLQQAADVGNTEYNLVAPYGNEHGG
jgi:hypothetical protein